MSFAVDRDLLALEPGLFRDVSWTAQKLVDVAGASVSGTTLTASGADFVGAGVAAGHIALVAGVAHEVVTRLSATQLTVSRLREEATAPAIPPGATTGAAVVIATFMPQIRIVHEQVMRSLGIEPSAASGAPAVEAGAPTEANVVNPGGLARLEALGALHLIYTGAAALVDAASPLWAKAEVYRARFAEERRATGAALDLDGDGIADAVRRASALRLVRG